MRQFLEQGSGHLAVTSSIAGVLGVPFSGSYTGSKHAIHVSIFHPLFNIHYYEYNWPAILFLLQGYYESLRTERMSNPEIRISLLCPGPVFTNFLSQSFTSKDGEVG